MNDKMKKIWFNAFNRHHRVMMIFITVFILFYLIMLYFFPIVICCLLLVYLVLCYINRESFFYADHVLSTYYSRSFLKGYFMYFIKNSNRLKYFLMKYFCFFTPVAVSWCRINRIKKLEVK